MQNLYTASTISASGKITSIAIKYSNTLASDVTCTGVTVKLGHTNLTNLTGTFANNYATGQGGQVTVLSDAVVTLPAAAANTWHAINFTTPFEYNGIDNLVVDINRPNNCTGDVPEYYNTGTSYIGAMWTTTPANPTGGVANYLINMKLTFAGGDDAVEYGGVTSNNAPFSTTLNHMQMLHLASEISGTGPITGLGFQSNALTSAQSYTYTLKLGHTTVSALTTTLSDNFNAGAPSTIVINGTLNIPAGIPAGAYFWVPFPGTFIYNGHDNLIVDIEIPASDGLTALRTANTTAGRRAAGSIGSLTANLALDSVTYHTKFRFNGGTMDVMTTVNAGLDSPFYDNAYSTQYLYRANQLGTSGAITGLACRSGYVSGTTVTGFNHTVKMGHVTSPLTTTFSTNLPADAVTVYNGTMSIPAVEIGDWINIPFTSAFNYNGKDDLIVEIRGTSSSPSVLACQGTNAPGYVSRLWGPGSATATTGVLLQQLIHARFTIQK